MATSHLTIEEFFSRLSSLFESRRKAGHGSVFLTQKRLNWPDSTVSPSPPNTDPAAFPDLHPSGPLPVLIRATDGKSKDKVKLSTVVQAEQLEGFFVRYAEVCKGGMPGLKKRDRSKNKAKAKKRKGGGGDGEKKP